MKKFVAWLLVLALTATVSIGATLAYLTDTDEDVNVMTLGKVKIDQLEYERVDPETKDDAAAVQSFHDNKPLLPAVTDKDNFNWETNENYVNWEQIGKDGYTSGIWNPDEINNELDKMVFVKNKGDYDAYVRSVFAFEAVPGWTFDDFQSKVHLNVNTNPDVISWEWIETPDKIGEGTYFVAVATYKEALKPGQLSEISLSQIALDSSVTNEDMEALGDTYNILVKSQAVQADGFATAEAALNEGFGGIALASLLWDSDQPVKGIDVRTALHFEKGDASKQITGKVTNVVYGLNKDYPEIVENYDGTLVTDEQEVDVYSYYVQKDDSYTVYFLADGRIYSPKDSNRLYKNMRALKSVDTSNYDVSRVVNMHELFRFCHSLKDIDVSHWDTGNVTIMSSVFDECLVLSELDVSKWDTGNVETMAFMFWSCLSLEWIDVSDWDTGNVVAFNSMFSDSKANTGRMKINNLDFSGWDMSSAKDISYMFYGCGQMTDLDLSSWDVSNVTTMHHMFCDCFKMENYNFSGWNTESLTIMNAMFNGNEALKSIDVSDFDTQNVYDFNQVFDGCYSLEEIIGLNKWDTSNADRFVTFLTSTKVREIDLSSFNASNVKYMKRMFYANSELTTIYVGDQWQFDISTLDTTSANAGYSGMTDMFENNPKLVGGNGSTPESLGNKTSTGALYARVDTPEAPGLLTHIDDKPVTNP